MLFAKAARRRMGPCSQHPGANADADQEACSKDYAVLFHAERHSMN